MTFSESLGADGVEQLTRTLAGRIVTSVDVDWDTVPGAWNLSVDQHPEFVALPENIADVSEVVNFAC